MAKKIGDPTTKLKSVKGKNTTRKNMNVSKTVTIGNPTNVNAIKDKMSSNMADLKNKVNTMKKKVTTDIDNAKSNVNTMKTNAANMKTNVANMKTDLMNKAKTLKSGVNKYGK